MYTTWGEPWVAAGWLWVLFWAVVALAVIGVMLAVTRGYRRGEFTGAMPDRRSEMLARLEREYAAGTISREEYEARRRDIELR